MKAQIKKFLLQTPLVRNLAVFLYRVNIVIGFIIRNSGVHWRAVKWLFSSRETTNITYELTTINDEYLAALISDITGCPYREVLGYFAELAGDVALQSHISRQVALSEWAVMADSTARFGRRKGWYALVRIVKPAVVIETGVDKGLGACLITSALLKNAAEGHAGRYYGTDINPKAGYLLSGIYREYGEILYGDSIDSLQKFARPIDLFINDSDHSATYEAEEYETIKDKLAPGAIVLGDNSHGNDKLLNFSIKYQRHFLFFKEQPADHWCPGEGIGISFTRDA